MKADLHVHSVHSDDGRQSPAEIIARAKEIGLGCIAITDHDSADAFREFDDSIIVIPGEEVSSKKGHIIALGIDRYIKRDMPVKETIDAIHEAGGIAIAAHPYRFWTGLGRRNVIPEFDGVEALNARSTKLKNKRSYALAKKFGKLITAGSDAHRTSMLGKGYVEVPDSCRTWQDVIQAIKDGNVTPHSSNHGPIATLRYVGRCLFNWTRRGFRDI